MAEQEEGVEVNHTLEEVPGAGCEEVIGDGCEGVMREDLFGEFADDLFLPSAERRRQSRAEKRKERHAHGLERAADRRGSGGRPQRSGLDMSRTEVQRLQETDAELTKIAEGEQFFRQNRLLYWHWVPRGQPEEAAVDQIVLPKQCRRGVLQLAHTVPLGGHLGKKKTTARVMRRFYWPTLHRHVADFCRSCEQCQKSSHQKVPRAPWSLYPLLVSHLNASPWM